MSRKTTPKNPKHKIRKRPPVAVAVDDHGNPLPPSPERTPRGSYIVKTWNPAMRFIDMAIAMRDEAVEVVQRTAPETPGRWRGIQSIGDLLRLMPAARAGVDPGNQLVTDMMQHARDLLNACVTAPRGGSEAFAAAWENYNNSITDAIPHCATAPPKPPRWSVPLPLSKLARMLHVKDGRTVKANYPLHRVSRQSYKIDINAVSPPQAKHIPTEGD